MNISLSKDKIQQSVQSNINNAFQYIFDNKNLIINSSASLKRFINEVACIVNKDLIVDKKYLFRNGKNSSKYNYINTKFVDKFYNFFIDDLYLKLIDIEPNYIKIAAWVEWNIDFVGHIFSDGCGRIAKLISSWVLMRGDCPLPNYADGSSEFKSIRESYRKRFALTERPIYHTPKDTLKYQTFLNYYNKLFVTAEKNMNSKRVFAAGGLIFNSRGDFLILESAKDEVDWVVPGGKLELGEAPIQALQREIFEETGLDIKDVQLLGHRRYTSPRGNRYFFFDYSATVLNEKPVQINEESQSFKWITRKQLNDYQFSNSIKDFFKTYLRNL